jgi:hypothetical protein
MHRNFSPFFYLGGQSVYGRSVGRIGSTTCNSHSFPLEQVREAGGSNPSNLDVLLPSTFTGRSRNSPCGISPKANFPLSSTDAVIRIFELFVSWICRVIREKVAPLWSRTTPLTLAAFTICRFGRMLSFWQLYEPISCPRAAGRKQPPDPIDKSRTGSHRLIPSTPPSSCGSRGRGSASRAGRGRLQGGIAR